MLVGVYQNHPEFGEIQTNVEKAIQDLSSVEADLIVLPELFNTGYQFVSIQELEALAEEIPAGKTCRAMMDLARDRNMVFVFGLAERDGRHFLIRLLSWVPMVLWAPTGKHIFFLKKKISLPPEIQVFASLI